MRYYLRCLLGGLLLLPGPLLAQRTFSLTLGGQAHLAGGRFADDQVVSGRISTVPDVYRTWLLGAVVGLSPRYAVQATFGQPNFGLSFASQRDYRQSPSEGVNVAGFPMQVLECAVVLRRNFFIPRTLSRHWFADLGLDLIDTSIAGGGSFGFANIDRNLTTGPGIEATGTSVMFNPNRVGVRLGLGHEWALNHGNRHFLSLQLISSLGLRDLKQYRMTSVVWERGRTIAPLYYTNQVATRFTFVGLQARYRFQL